MATSPAPGRERWWPLHVVLALLTYGPLLLTQPGVVGADTKAYLYLDPGRLLSRAAYLWDENVAAGTVTHQNIGYLFPMGPYYWAMERLGLPDWVAQRLWLATILFAAGAGVAFLLRSLPWQGGPALSRGAPVAVLAYALSPYVLHYAARHSVLLLPWAALPWLLVLAIRAARRGGWRWPALFALVVNLVAGVNATALLLAGLGVVIWFPYAVWVRRELSGRDAVATMARLGVLTLGVSVWWMAGLWAQGRYGMDILRFTETPETVAGAALSFEVLRGLGYWYLYGNDRLGPWLEPGRDYTQRLGALAVSFSLPTLTFLAAAVTRWRHKVLAVTLVALGVLLSVGAHPWDHPSPLGRLFRAAASTSAGLALRSTPRAVPLVALGSALLLAAGVRALADRCRRVASLAAAAVALLAVVNLFPLFTGGLVSASLRRDEDLPAYWEEAVRHLDERGGDTRVLELPGIDFAAYRWGNTLEPITPGLMDRPYLARELVPYGSDATADLLIALDRRLQEGVLDPAAIAPVARLFGVGDVVLRSDLQFERYRTPRPRPTWRLLRSAPGLGAATAFGDPVPNLPIERFPLLDERELAEPRDAEHPPPVAAFPVVDARPVVRAAPGTRPLLVAGDGEGLVEAAAAGLLDPATVVRYSAGLDAADLASALDGGADLLLTDSNRRRGRRWGTVRENVGYTERAGEEPLRHDASDNRLVLFPGAGDDARTVAEQRGVVRVDASGYGNPVSFTPEDRAANALDGDPRTAWRVGAFGPVEGERLEIELAAPVSADRLVLLQPVTGPRNRFITAARLRFDGGDPVDVTLDESSRAEPGQVVTFPRRSFRTLTFEVRSSDAGRRDRYEGLTGVGLAEIALPGVRVDEVLRLPEDLLGRAGPRSVDHTLRVLLARARSDPADPVRSDEEVRLARTFSLPTARSFRLEGAARLSAAAPDTVVDAVLGYPDPGAGGVTAASNGHLPGDLAARARAAIDQDPRTAWTPAFRQSPATLTYAVAAPLTFDRLELQVVNDGRHSVPTALRVWADGTPVADVAVPPLPATTSGQGATTTVPLSLGTPVRATTVAVEVVAVREVTTTDYYSEAPIALPVAIAELGIAGLGSGAAPVALDVCRSDLLTVDGRPFPVRVRGSVADAVARRPLALEPCEAGASLDLAAGAHDIRTAPGMDTGVDVDRLVLVSGPGGAAGPVDPPPRPAPPTVAVEEHGRDRFSLRVEGATEPFWLVLGQSLNDGWRASVSEPFDTSLGRPALVDGYASGWYVEPGTASVLHVELRWTPQRTIWAGLAVSAVATLLCVGLAVLDPGRRRPRAAVTTSTDVGSDVALALPWRDRITPPRRPAGLAGAALVVVGLAVQPWVGVLAALAVLVVAWRPRWGGVVAFGGPALVALSGLYVVVQQARHRLPPGFEWPTYFERVHVVALAAVVLVCLDVALRGGAPDQPPERHDETNPTERDHHDPDER